MEVENGCLFVFVGFFGVLVAEARVQVKEATERLGGEYSGSLHPKCTHLVVQISFARHDRRVLLKLFSVQTVVLVFASPIQIGCCGFLT